MRVYGLRLPRDNEWAMSQENVEIVRSAFAASAAGDVGAVVEVLDAEIEMPGAVGGLEEGTVQRGRDAVSRALLPDLSVWTERRYELQDVIAVDDRVVALVHEHRRGKGSGIDVGADMAFVYSFKDGKVSRIAPYMSQSEALDAVGLRK